ncbi:methyltransferase domain-containing protein [Brasilonema sp. CT11]|nr:methyltransferase domain-containing protein [Brasilonema sp. CT11]
MQNQVKRLRYFNIFLDSIEHKDDDLIKAFGHHVHWGYWKSTSLANNSVDDFRKAAEELSCQMSTAAGVADNQSVLDVGCGFGGTIASINERFKQMNLVGVNIDDRQIARARQQVKAAETNQVEFVEADACNLPFADASFDVVLAVECIFHFPSRELFFKEARRVLRPGGRLAVCDFIPVDMLMPGLGILDFFMGDFLTQTYGQSNLRYNYSLSDYEKLAQKTGFILSQQRDITVNTLPSYEITRQLMRKATPPGIGAEIDNLVNQAMEWVSRQGLLRYMIFSFQIA